MPNPAESTLDTDGPLDAECAAQPPAPCLFLVFQASRPLDSSMRYPLAEIDEVCIGRDEARSSSMRTSAEKRILEIRIADPTASSVHARLFRNHRQWILEDAGSKNGTLVRGTRQASVALEDGAVFEIGKTFFVFRAAAPSSPADRAPMDSAELGGPPDLDSLAPSLVRRFGDVSKVADSTLPVLILGETGTGKELVARAIHRLSGRRGEFVAANCGALASSLLEAELFGSRKGAFTGAHEDRPGLIRSAEGGTLFLDEIGDLPLASQPAFLRALQEREVLPVGETHPVRVNVRIVAATHRNLDGMVAEGSMRADLLARIRGHVVHLPPLRERREDLGILLRALIHRLAEGRAQEISLSSDAARALLADPWPLNIRQLEHALAQALILSGNVLTRSALFGDAPAALPALRQQLEALLAQHHGNLAAVARDLQKAPNQVRRWLRQLNIDLDAYRD